MPGYHRRFEQVRVGMQLPGSKAMADLGELEIKDGAVYLPFKSVFICHARGEMAG